jgi:hypothetical protein
MQPKILNPRSRSQEAFYNWLEDAMPKLQIPIQVENQTRRQIAFSFAGIPTILQGIAFFRSHKLRNPTTRCRSPQRRTFGEMTVSVEWQGTTWDLLFSWDASAMKTPNGYICDQCPPENCRTFESRKALWRDHLFDPLLKWVNEDLASASAIGIYQVEGATWAKLLHQDEDKESDCCIAKVKIER